MAIDADSNLGPWIRRAQYVTCPVCGRYEVSPAKDATLSPDQAKELRPCPSRPDTGCTGVVEVDAFFEAGPDGTHFDLT
ncbi:hypothetical protein ACQEVZ_60740 [Dactylosporangium sp. CA-152071]|uniref:hypothetical protein n=1 Tax=Dactylosporangium sp. CA-152071 TaxID=3239933 RepID=UPI003D9021F6